MSNYSKRIPPVKLIIDENEYNILIQILINNALLDNEKISDEATKLKAKLLTYSVPHHNDDETVSIDVRFFINEATMLLNQFIYLLKDIVTVEGDYLSVLEKVRASRKNQLDK